MKKTIVLAATAIASALAGCASRGAPASAAPGHPLAAALLADVPHPALAPELALYGQFVGAWDVDVTNYPEGGAAQHAKGEWIFGWVIEGRAIQDTWIVPARGERDRAQRDAGPFGTTIRFPVPSQGRWRIAWLNPVRGVVDLMWARPVGDEIVQEGIDGDGQPFRWIFHDISPERFRWRSEERLASGAWRVNQEMQATRRRP